MSALQATASEALQELSLPGRPLSAEECLASAENLRGRVVVITGAASGFGAAFAKLAASYGASVLASDVNLKAVEAVVDDIKQKGGKALATYCDTTDWDSQVAMFKKGIEAFDAIDSVVCNAGVGEFSDWFQLPLDEAGDPKRPNMTTLDVNLTGAMYSAQLAFHYLPKNTRKGKKSLILVGSIASFMPIPGAPHYAMSKHAMLGLYRTLRWNPFDITVNLLAPWFAETAIISGGTAALIAGYPLAKVDDVVLGMLKASSDDDCHGEIIAVDAQGIMSISYDSLLEGEGNFHHAMVRRHIKDPSSESKESYYHDLIQRGSGALQMLVQ